MSDVVVTVPKDFHYEGKTGLKAWIAEGDAPNIAQGERVYIVHNGKLRGYAPLYLLHVYEDENDVAGELGDLDRCPPRRKVPGCALVRKGGAVAVTIDQHIRGFRGFRYRWWKRQDEVPFPNWQTP